MLKSETSVALFWLSKHNFENDELKYFSLNFAYESNLHCNCNV